MSEITVDALRSWLEDGKPVTVLDVRQIDDWKEWAIPGSIHADAYDALRMGNPNALGDVELPGDRPVVTVCYAGVTSNYAIPLLRARGLEAHSLSGGMQAWSMAWNSAEVALASDAVRILQVRRTGKGCLSYIVGSDGEAAVIDPALEASIYIELAQAQGWHITHVFDTHIHADHLSRGHVLAVESGATFYLPAQERAKYPFTNVNNGDAFTIGKAQIKALHTPGHTFESMCYLIDEQAVVTGDTVFLNSIGRPDLASADSDETRIRAEALYNSLQEIASLPIETLVLPGHTSEPLPFDGAAHVAALSDVRANIALLHVDKDEFVETILPRIPPTPPNHMQIVHFNEAGMLPEGDPTILEAGANRCAVM